MFQYTPIQMNRVPLNTRKHMHVHVPVLSHAHTCSHTVSCARPRAAGRTLRRGLAPTRTHAQCTCTRLRAHSHWWAVTKVLVRLVRRRCSSGRAEHIRLGRRIICAVVRLFKFWGGCQRDPQQGLQSLQCQAVQARLCLSAPLSVLLHVCLVFINHPCPKMASRVRKTLHPFRVTPLFTREMAIFEEQ